jgi:signal peptidase I
MATSTLMRPPSAGVTALAFDELAERRTPTRKIAEPYRYLGVSESDNETKFGAIHQIISHGDESYRHKHNFDQIRLVIEGEMRLGKNIVAGPGDVVYFPESVMYGPTTYEDGHMFLFQWPGVSEDGFYLHYDDVVAGLNEMRELGGEIDFDRGGVWKYADGRLDDVWEALGQHTLGRNVTYAEPRYGDVVVLRSNAFKSHPVAHGVNVGVKHLGFLNETGPNVKVLDFGPNSTLEAGKAQAQQIWTSFEGDFTYEGKDYPVRSILYLPPGADRSAVSSKNGAKMLVINLSKKGQALMPFSEF